MSGIFVSSRLKVCSLAAPVVDSVRYQSRAGAPRAPRDLPARLSLPAMSGGECGV
jgi:hypothetical protein